MKGRNRFSHLSIHLFREVMMTAFALGYCKANVLVDIQSLNLMEKAMCTRRNSFIAIHATRHNCPNRIFAFGAVWSEHLRYVCEAVNRGFFSIKNVLHFSGGWLSGKFNAEVAPVIFYLRAVRYIKAKTFEDLNNLVFYQRMQVTHLIRNRW